MTTYTWNGSTSTEWRTTSNWTPNGIPGSTDTVIIPASLNNYPNLVTGDGSPTIGTLTIYTGGMLTITSNANYARTLTLGTSGSNAGAIVLAGASGHASAISVTGAGGFTNTGAITGTTASALSGGSGGIANSGGTINVTSGTMTVTSALTDTGSSQINIANGATLTTNKTLTNTSGTITVNGTLTETGTSQISNAGTITLSGGTLNETNGTPGGLSDSGTISGHGTLNLGAGNLTGGGSLVATGGTLAVTAHIDTVTGTAATSFEIGDGYTLSLLSTSAVGIANSIQPTLKFDGANGGTFSDTAATFGAMHLGDISGFSGTDKIVLKSYSSTVGGDTYSISGTTLTITNGSNSESFSFAAGTDMTHINVVDGGANDTIYFCFMAGTLVRTPQGEVAIESLKPGDLVLTSEGVARPVNWLGKQTVSTLFADPVRSLPIRVRAGALAENTPSRDLLVSPDHALLVDGVLIHASALVNGSSIVRETNVPRVFVYYHVELDDHSLILAENTPAETFVDNVDRMNFDNWAEFEALYPDGKTVEELPFPRAKAHRQVPVYIRVALADRAMAIGAGDSAAVA